MGVRLVAVALLLCGCTSRRNVPCATDKECVSIDAMLSCDPIMQLCGLAPFGAARITSQPDYVGLPTRLKAGSAAGAPSDPAWRFVAVPPGSKVVDGRLTKNGLDASFDPDLGGDYTVEL